MFALGIDIGYATIKTVLISEQKKLIQSAYIFHRGQLQKNLAMAIETCTKGVALENIKYCGVTGSGYSYVSEKIKVERINDITALVEGGKIICPSANAIVEIGGQSGAYIANIGDQTGDIIFSLNSGCSAGTGSFLEEQMNRLNLSIDDYGQLAAQGKSVPRIAGRCSVFAKTDIIHHQQEGVQVEDILLGLARAVAQNYKSMIVQNNPIKPPLIFTGGVSKNTAMSSELARALGVKEKDLIISDKSPVCAALGAASLAVENSYVIDHTLLMSLLEKNEVILETSEKKLFSNYQPLNNFGGIESHDKHKVFPENHRGYGYLGIDIGSTSTNLVLINDESQVLWYQYLRTKGDPVGAVAEGISALKTSYGDDFLIKGICTTGSGRTLIGKRLGAEWIKDEITAQSKATMTLAPSVDTVFEIGGQDSKYIHIKDQRVKEFQMNKVCAAGTGAFIEEQAMKLSLSLEAFTKKALESQYPSDLGERCTVFIEASIMEHINKGAPKEDIAAGLCYSIVKNYLNKVVGQQPIGDTIALQGGIAYNQGVVNAFRSLTGKEIIVLPYFSVTGAFGAATMALQSEKQDQVKSLLERIKSSEKVTIKRHNENKIEIENTKRQSDDLEELFLSNYTGEREAGKKTVGIPRVLFLHKLFPVFNTFFRELGYNTILTDQTDEELVALSQRYPLADACYPIKLVHGHVAKLVELKVDYIFLPSLETMKHDMSPARCDYGCVYMKNVSRIVASTVGLEEAGIKLLAPTLSFQMGKKYMMQSMIKLGKELGTNPAKTLLAMKKGMGKLSQYVKATEKKGTELVNSLKSHEIAFVIVTRAYGIKDPVLNMEVPKILKQMGHKVLTLSHLPAHDIDLSLEHENMYWPFGQHMISGAQLIRDHPNLYAIYLTNHGCGPDTIISKYFEEEMVGKPYLHLEVDEHASAVGVKTRIEAFINSVEEKTHKASHSKENLKEKELEDYVDFIDHKEVALSYDMPSRLRNKKIVMPNLYPYSSICKDILIQSGIDCDLLEESHAASIEKGLSHTISKEAHSLTGLIGDVLTYLENNSEKAMNHKDTQLLIPTNEGTEVQGQYSRVLRTILDKRGFNDIEILTPFMEDLIYEPDLLEKLMYGILAGDLILTAPLKDRQLLLDRVIKDIKEKDLNYKMLQDLILHIYHKCQESKPDKRLMILGESLIIFNEYLHHDLLKKLEEEGHRVMRSPLSERLVHMWQAHIERGHRPKASQGRKALGLLKETIDSLHVRLGEFSPYSVDLSFKEKHYDLSKMKAEDKRWDGILHLSSMYENTHTIVKLLYDGHSSHHKSPVLSMGIEKLMSEQNKLALESFIYFLKK